MLAELGSPNAFLDTGGESSRGVIVSSLLGRDRMRSAEPVGEVIWAVVDSHPHETIALGIEDWANGAIDRKLGEVDAP